ncbi:MAG TPA: AAA family ATPase [Humidesulfovibrio sp.]|uniref:AAA family ATPase n=1 Tax=Humidesulfovibrio sp. TaxID=2910988 RepID=UPI002CBA0E44|nr:AAA family ATPase [Humidesulfovibrio sp.]HWR03792.1 AAA family ATPase [Humidesulfovibrio sp.]
MTFADSAFRIPCIGDILDHEFPPRGDLVAPWLKEGESALIYAAPGVGKSMFALSLALAVAGGGKYLDWETPKPYRVLFVDGEMPMDTIKERTELLLKALPGIDQELIRQNLHVFARQFQDASVTFPNLATTEGQAELERQAVGYDLVILDNLSTLANVEDENASKAFQPIVGFLMRMKQLGQACILIHHSGKKASTYRGSSMLATTFEVILGLEKLTGLKAAHGTAFQIKWDKLRAKPDERIKSWEVWMDEDRWEFEAAASEEVDLLLEALRSGKYVNQKELAEALKWDESKVTRTKAKAIATGAIDTKQWGTAFGRAKDARTETIKEGDF